MSCEDSVVVIGDCVENEDEKVILGSTCEEISLHSKNECARSEIECTDNLIDIEEEKDNKTLQNGTLDNESDKENTKNEKNNEEENLPAHTHIVPTKENTHTTPTPMTDSNSAAQIISMESDLEFKGFPILPQSEETTENLNRLEKDQKKTFIRLEKLMQQSMAEIEDHCYYSVAVQFKNEGETKVPKQDGTFIHWEICDLKGNTFTLYVPVSRDVPFAKGNTIVLVNVMVKSVYMNAKNKPSIFIGKTSKIISLGVPERIINCRGRSNQKSCEHLVDKKRSPFCHEHLRKEYFTVSSQTMQLNMNVGLGPVKAGGSKKAAQRAGNDHYESFREFKVSSGNDSNIDKHPWYNLPDNQHITKILKTKNSIGSKYLRSDAFTPKNPSKKTSGIPLQYRNKRRRCELQNMEEPAAKRQKLQNTEDETEVQRRRQELLAKVRKSTKISIL